MKTLSTNSFMRVYNTCAASQRPDMSIEEGMSKNDLILPGGGDKEILRKLREDPHFFSHILKNKWNFQVMILTTGLCQCIVKIICDFYAIIYNIGRRLFDYSQDQNVHE